VSIVLVLQVKEMGSFLFVLKMGRKIELSRRKHPENWELCWCFWPSSCRMTIRDEWIANQRNLIRFWRNLRSKQYQGLQERFTKERFKWKFRFKIQVTTKCSLSLSRMKQLHSIQSGGKFACFRESFNF
jgi:hypothetical protein